MAFHFFQAHTSQPSFKLETPQCCVLSGVSNALLLLKFPAILPTSTVREVWGVGKKAIAENRHLIHKPDTVQHLCSCQERVENPDGQIPSRQGAKGSRAQG